MKLEVEDMRSPKLDQTLKTPKLFVICHTTLVCTQTLIQKQTFLM